MKAKRYMLGKAPLVMVLAQIRFSPILTMNDYVPRIQEALRKRGFPRFRSEETEQIRLGPSIETSTAMRWLFGGADSTANVVLTNSFVAYEVSSYSSFNNFCETLHEVLLILGEIVEIELSESLGLRFVNYVRPTGELSIRQLVSETMCGLPPADLGVQAVIHQHAMRTITKEGRMDIRLVESPQSFLPADLSGAQLEFADDLKSSAGWILDVDHRAELNSAFDADAIRNQIWRLHDISEGAFLAIATEKALSEWEAEEVSQ